MEIVNLSLPATNPFASKYLQHNADVQSFFHYRFDQASSDVARLAELRQRTFPREAVARHIESFMRRYPTSPSIQHSLEKLKKNHSVVVIGGQQAGILTGPLYTIHKVISIIKLAEQKEKQLKIPVVPVFWIAGEDHDYQEVNHVFISNGQKPTKWIYPEKILHKKMVTDIELDKQVAISWIQKIIENFGETSYTKDILSFMHTQLERATTFVDFFANLIMEMFKDYGLLLIDSGDPHLRQLEKDILIQQITHHSSITNSWLKQQRFISAQGYKPVIETNEQAANLFYYDKKGNERILLEFDHQKDRFVGKNGGISFSMEELLALAARDPARLSNNVVTRPLTQECLFPTIAFIAGPGEIAYWAELKLIFEDFGMKLPPIVPRLNITLLDRSIETDINELHLELSDLLSHGTHDKKQQYLETVKDTEVESLFLTAKEQLQHQYRLIEQKTTSLNKGLLPLLLKNEHMVLTQLEFMKNKLEESVEWKHQSILKKFNRVDLALRPDGVPQERIWNVWYYLNQYGMSLIDDLLRFTYVFDGTHKIIKM